MSTQKLLATDCMLSPLSVHPTSSPQAVAYSVYGHRVAFESLPVTGFTGQLFEPELRGYLLGNGHRAFNPALMRFHSPDQVSPFDDGGINAYAYCAGNPVSRFDPSGQTVTVGGHVFDYAASTMTTFGAFNRVADQVVDKRINPEGAKPKYMNRVGNTVQFWGGIVADVSRSMQLQKKGLADAPEGVVDSLTYIVQTVNSARIATVGALMVQSVFTGWVAKARENTLSVPGVVAEALYEVSGAGIVVEGAQAAASLVVRGAQGAAGLVVRGAQGAAGLVARGAQALYTSSPAGMIRNTV